MANSLHEYQRQMHQFESSAQLDTQLAADIAARLSQAIAARGEALLVVSGGKSPKGYMQKLSQADLDWGKVTITLADERWVDTDHDDSNEKLVRDNLLVNGAAEARFVSLYSADEVHPYAGRFEVIARLQGLVTFDVVVLGMGLDGHTASLFPLSEEIAVGLTSHEPCIAVTPIHASHQRMTMTLSRILDSRHIILQLTTAEKLSVYHQALADGPVEDMPVRAVLKQDLVPVGVYYAD